MPPAGGMPCSRATSPAPAGFVELLLFAAGPAAAGLQSLALLDGIVLLGVARRDFLAVDAQLEDFDRGRVVRRKLMR